MSPDTLTPEQIVAELLAILNQESTFVTWEKLDLRDSQRHFDIFHVIYGGGEACMVIKITYANQSNSVHLYIQGVEKLYAPRFIWKILEQIDKRLQNN